MIILTVKTGSRVETRVFQQQSILVGKSGTSSADIELNEPGIEASHVRIFAEEGRYLVENIANDPFLTLNDLPFGKKAIKNQDTIQVGNTVIVFEEKKREPSLPKDTHQLDTPSLISIVEQRIEERQHQKSAPLPPKQEEKKIFDWKKEEETLDVESLLKEVEELDSEGYLLTNERPGEKEIKKEVPLPQQQKAAEEPGAPPAPAPQKTPKRPIEVYDSANDEPEVPFIDPAAEAPKNPSPLGSPAIWITLLALFFFLSAIVSSGVYSRLEEKAAVQELKAASGIADVALALTYAQINAIKAPQQNWSDPDFLNQNIAAVLSAHHRSIAELDHHGHILNTDYMLRIYTNSDMTRYLIIAQPEASLTQWLVPKSSIILDSTKMELRKSDDLKGLNRLLVNAGALNDEGGPSVLALVNGGEIIPLSSLADASNQNGFAPPKALEHVRPGAENLVYNAPRYSKVGEQLLQEAIALANHRGEGVEFKKFQDELKVINRFPNVVLYTSKGLKSALIGKKALETLMPGNKYLIAYSRYDSTKGTNSHLIMEDSSAKQKDNEISLNAPIRTEVIPPPSPTPAVPVEPIRESARFSNAFDNEVDVNSPLYIKIVSLQKERKKALKPLSTQIIELLQKQNEDFVPNFSERVHLLLKDYENEVEKQQNAAIFKLKNIYQEHHEMSLSDFSTYVKAAGLKGIADEKKKEEEKPSVNPPFDAEKFQKYLINIDRALDFESLLNSTKEIASVLNLENISNANHLSRYQNRTRAQAIERLNEFLLSPYSPLSAKDFTPKNRALLVEVMKSAWISDSEEQKFYLTEFDHHSSAL